MSSWGCDSAASYGAAATGPARETPRARASRAQAVRSKIVTISVRADEPNLRTPVGDPLRLAQGTLERVRIDHLDRNGNPDPVLHLVGPAARRVPPGPRRAPIRAASTCTVSSSSRPGRVSTHR